MLVQAGDASAPSMAETTAEDRRPGIASRVLASPRYDFNWEFECKQYVAGRLPVRARGPEKLPQQRGARARGGVVYRAVMHAADAICARQAACFAQRAKEAK
jgi:hypothetical protein